MGLIYQTSIGWWVAAWFLEIIVLIVGVLVVRVKKS